MEVIADFHIHSKHSRAVSQSMEPATITNWASRKGINLVGTGDFTHPLWLKELKDSLSEAEEGLFRLNTKIQDTRYKQTSNNKSQITNTRFVLSAEISCIYSKNNKVRKIHLIVLAPDFKTVEKINAQLSWSGNLSSDGRPILGMDAKEIAKIVFETNPSCMVVPAHIWTPWFSLFGSKSGFDSMEECFEELTPKIYAVETGLSSDPAMNWRLSQLENITIISNSDAHSPAKLGREANVFEIDNDKYCYDEIADILKKGDKERFKYTIEFYPEEGKYHLDGHRKCDLCLMPDETKKHKGICPKCGSALTVGVMNRVNSLADIENPDSKNRVPFKSLVPLQEIIADVFGVGVNSKKVNDEYQKITDQFNEFDALINVPEKELAEVADPETAKGIIKARKGEVTKIAGYDGVFGIISVTGKIRKRKTEKTITKEKQQMGLF